MLTGIVVTNAIVLLDLVEQYRDRGLGLQDALVEGGRHRLRPILMTAFATMLALLPLAVTGGGGGVGGAFISGPLAIVVIGGLFTSTLLTLVLVPVLYSLTSRFTGPRTTRDLDLLLDAAEDRRFKPLGQRTIEQAAPVPAPEPAMREFAVALKIEPEDGTPGDPAVLEALRAAGYGLTYLDGSRQVQIEVPTVAAASAEDAAAHAVRSVFKIVPAKGYRVSDPVAAEKKAAVLVG
jgi:hydrophobic/amphiphilic exporter-1 (mainly G- bacteria), HAE1 family